MKFNRYSGEFVINTIYAKLNVYGGLRMGGDEIDFIEFRF